MTIVRMSEALSKHCHRELWRPDELTQERQTSCDGAINNWPKLTFFHIPVHFLAFFLTRSNNCISFSFKPDPILKHKSVKYATKCFLFFYKLSLHDSWITIYFIILQLVFKGARKDVRLAEIESLKSGADTPTGSRLWWIYSCTGLRPARPEALCMFLNATPKSWPGKQRTYNGTKGICYLVHCCSSVTACYWLLLWPVAQLETAFNKLKQYKSPTVAADLMRFQAEICNNAVHAYGDK